MGCIFSCCGLLSGPLERAQTMTTTKNGNEISQMVLTEFKTSDRYEETFTKNLVVRMLLGRPYNRITQVLPLLLITGVGGLTQENIRQHRIRCIVNATYDLPLYKVEGIETVRVPVEDTEDSDISIYFDDVCDLIDKQTKSNLKVVVHCWAGVCRSATLVIAYLMKYHRKPLKDAFLFLKNKRPIICPNFAFFGQLIKYEKRLFGRNSVEMVGMGGRGGQIPDIYLLIGDCEPYGSTETIGSSFDSELSQDVRSKLISTIFE